MVRSPISPADGLIRGTIERYQETFNSGDRDAWLGLFTDDGLLEDPAGSPPRKGREGLSRFWDVIHEGRSDRVAGTVRMVQGPAVCGLEAAWAFELRVPLGDKGAVVEIIDEAVFTEDGRICRLRAFWNEATVRVE
ncbi:MAG TPA: nuclear transport factor 2 family protein, partial [Acidimicrobiales bacterium]|nr:nuclear transport factor 2 family protein [Acidimicrobiales bacterium]